MGFKPVVTLILRCLKEEKSLKKTHFRAANTQKIQSQNKLGMESI